MAEKRNQVKNKRPKKLYTVFPFLLLCGFWKMFFFWKLILQDDDDDYKNWCLPCTGPSYKYYNTLISYYNNGIGGSCTNSLPFYKRKSGNRGWSACSHTAGRRKSRLEPKQSSSTSLLKNSTGLLPTEPHLHKCLLHKQLVGNFSLFTNQWCHLQH